MRKREGSWWGTIWEDIRIGNTRHRKGSAKKENRKTSSGWSKGGKNRKVFWRKKKEQSDVEGKLKKVRPGKTEEGGGASLKRTGRGVKES